MFTNVSFRMKLLAVVAAPVLVMMGLVWLVVSPRLDATAAADRTLRQSQLGQSSLALLGELQGEREASAGALTAEVGAARPALVDARSRVDRALRDFGDTAAGLQSPALVRFVSNALDAGRDIAGLRSDVDDRSIGEREAFDRYSRLSEQFVRLGGNVSAGASDAELIRRGHALDLFVQGSQQAAELRGFVAMRLADGDFGSADYGRAAALDANADRLFEQFVAHAPEADLASYRAARSAPGFEASDGLIVDVLEAGIEGEIPTVTTDQWLEGMGRRIESLASAQRDVSNRLAGAAAAAESAARSSALSTLVMATAAALLALLTAGMLSRSMARRLRRISDQATDIATDRLPEVLAALQHASTPDLADSLPQVRADGTDEVGRLAVAFNAVLAASVESSLDHAKQRHETLTNLLISLGRRNQCIIERQLELIDGMEATEENPELLEGLFRLDHLATSLRRNAENLLVLASDGAGRTWDEPVSLFDVARSAASEVEDMDRVLVEFDVDDSTMLQGRFSVDLSHLLAELVENAASFSSPQVPVVVSGSATPDGFEIVVADQGIGMSAEEIEAVNRGMIAPVELDRIVADRVGFQVVGRLAARLGVGVALSAREHRGVEARIRVPSALLEVERAALEESMPVPLAVVAPPPMQALAAAPQTAPARVWSAPDPVPFEPFGSAEVSPAPPIAVVPLIPAAMVHPAPVPWALTDVPPIPATPQPVVPVEAVVPIVHPAPPPVMFSIPRGSASIAPTRLVTRVPGRSLDRSSEAAEFDAGVHRRLPTPNRGETLDTNVDAKLDAADDLEAAQRRDALNRLATGVAHGRSLFVREVAESAPEAAPL